MVDTLSHSPIQSSDNDVHNLQEGAKYLMETCINSYLLAASVWQNFVKLKQLTLSAQHSPTTAKMSGPHNRTNRYRSSPTAKLEDSSQFIMICYYMGKKSSTSCHVTRDLIKDSPGTSRNTKVSLMSQHFCLVAWYLKAHQRLDRAMPHLCKRVLNPHTKNH